MIRITVVLPDPFLPIIPTNSPARTPIASMCSEKAVPYRNRILRASRSIFYRQEKSGGRAIPPRGSR